MKRVVVEMVVGLAIWSVILAVFGMKGIGIMAAYDAVAFAYAVKTKIYKRVIIAARELAYKRYAKYAAC